MLVRFTKGPPGAPDALACIRDDGSTASLAMPRQGILPHDALHFVAETTLGWSDAFFGLVAGGAEPAALAAQLHDRRSVPANLRRARQAEALVACLQAEQWGGAADPAAAATRLARACRERGVPAPDIAATELARVRAALREFGAAWRPLAPGAFLERTFPR